MIRCTAPRIVSSLRQAASPHVRWIATSRKACDAQFDIFAKLKDPPGETDTSKRRKPSDRVLHLVDEILSLTLIEAADLCDLCQDKLSPGNGSVIPGRMPFPHPGGMFAMPGMMPGMGAPTGAPSMPAPQAAPAAPAAAPAADDAAPVAKPAEEKKIDPKAPVTIKLMSFEASKKISVIKEVRAITALGLKESKELVEAAPKILKKGVPRDEAEALVEKLKAATGVVEFI